MDDMDSILGQPVNSMASFMGNSKINRDDGGMNQFDQFGFGTNDNGMNFGGMPMNDMNFGMGGSNNNMNNNNMMMVTPTGPMRNMGAMDAQQGDMMGPANDMQFNSMMHMDSDPRIEPTSAGNTQNASAGPNGPINGPMGGMDGMIAPMRNMNGPMNMNNMNNMNNNMNGQMPMNGSMGGNGSNGPNGPNPHGTGGPNSNNAARFNVQTNQYMSPRPSQQGFPDNEMNSNSQFGMGIRGGNMNNSMGPMNDPMFMQQPMPFNQSGNNNMPSGNIPGGNMQDNNMINSTGIARPNMAGMNRMGGQMGPMGGPMPMSRPGMRPGAQNGRPAGPPGPPGPQRLGHNANGPGPGPAPGLGPANAGVPASGGEMGVPMMQQIPANAQKRPLSNTTRGAPARKKLPAARATKKKAGEKGTEKAAANTAQQQPQPQPLQPPDGVRRQHPPRNSPSQPQQAALQPPQQTAPQHFNSFSGPSMDPISRTVSRASVGPQGSIVRQFEFASQQPPSPRPPGALRLRVQFILTLNQELIKMCMSTPLGTGIFEACITRLQSNIEYLHEVYKKSDIHAALALPPPLTEPTARLPALTAPYKKLEELFQSR